MSLEKLLVTDFINNNVEYIERVEKMLSTEAMSTNKRANLICDVLKKGVHFGLTKGGYIEKCTQLKIQDVKEKKFRKWFNEIIYSINEDIDEHLQKTKYKKK